MMLEFLLLVFALVLYTRLRPKVVINLAAKAYHACLKLRLAYDNYNTCSFSTENSTLVIHFAGFKAKTDFVACSLGKGFFFGGSYFSNKPEDLPEPVDCSEADF